MNRLGWRALVLLALVPAACQRRAPSAIPHPHYELGAPYRAGGIWRYPQEQFAGSFTGLVVVQPAGHPVLTADGEAYDPDAMQAASPTLQLPAIARVTNLGTGRQVMVRIDDRGPETPGRTLAVTPRVADLLGMSRSQPARVRVTLLPEETRAAEDDLPGAPRLNIAAAPRIAVTAQPLDGPGTAPQPLGRAPDATPPAAPPLRLPETVTQTRPDPGQLYVRLSPFTDRLYAVRQAEELGGRAGQVVPADGAGFVARLGPFATTADADAALDHAIRAGVTDARIVVE